MEIHRIKVEDIVPDSKQPRQRHDEQHIKGLAASYGDYGSEEPIKVTPDGEGRYKIVYGEQRWRAAKQKGLKYLDCIVEDVQDEKKLLFIRLKENVLKKGLHPLEEGAAYRRAMDEFGMTEREVASDMGVSQAKVHNYANMATNLHDLLKNQIGEGQLNLSTTQALEIAKITPKEKQYEVAEIVKEKNIWDYHPLHELVKRINLGMKIYGNIPMRKSEAKKEEPGLCLEAMVDDVLHIEKQKGGRQKRRDRSYHQRLRDRIIELGDMLEPWLAPKIPITSCFEVEDLLNNLKLSIDEFRKGLKAHREPLL